MSEKIIVKINDGKIIVKFGDQGIQGPIGPTGPAGPGGTTDHAALTNLDYNLAGHTGFQTKLVYIESYRAYEIN